MFKKYFNSNVCKKKTLSNDYTKKKKERTMNAISSKHELIWDQSMKHRKEGRREVLFPSQGSSDLLFDKS